LLALAFATFASTSDSRRIRTSSAPSLISVPPYFEDAAALRLLLRGVGQDDAARGHLLFLERLDDQTIAQRLQIHSGPPVLRTL
jgi:hypothetical protein